MIEWVFYGMISLLSFLASNSLFLAGIILAVLVFNHFLLDYLDRRRLLAF